MDYNDRQLITLEPHTRTKTTGVHVYDLCLVEQPLGITVIIVKKETCYWVEIGTGLEYTAGTWHTRHKIAHWGGGSTIATGLQEQVGVHIGQMSRHMGDIWNMRQAHKAALNYCMSSEGQADIQVAQLKIAKHYALLSKKASASASILNQFFSGDLI